MTEQEIFQVAYAIIGTLCLIIFKAMNENVKTLCVKMEAVLQQLARHEVRLDNLEDRDDR